MEQRRVSHRTKRHSKQKPDDGSWDCSVCTFKNSQEAYKCAMCDVRKGTSTRKPRINPQLVAQQVAQQFAIPPPVKKEKSTEVEAQEEDEEKKETCNTSTEEKPPKLKNIDRTSFTQMEVTVGNVTVIITDYKPKEWRSSVESHSNIYSDTSDASSNTSVSNDIAEEQTLEDH